jgi:hypothetical protein
MELQKEWLDRAEKQWSYEAHDIMMQGDKPIWEHGFGKGATEMLKAVEALVNSEIASLQKEHDRSNDLQNQSNINQQISAIKLLYFKLNFLKPLTDV